MTDVEFLHVALSRQASRIVAHQILDSCRDGTLLGQLEVDWALRVTGDIPAHTSSAEAQHIVGIRG